MFSQSHKIPIPSLLLATCSLVCFWPTLSLWNYTLEAACRQLLTTKGFRILPETSHLRRFVLQGWQYDEDIILQFCLVDPTNMWNQEDRGVKRKGRLWLDNPRKKESLSESSVSLSWFLLKQKRKIQERERERDDGEGRKKKKNWWDFPYCCPWRSSKCFVYKALPWENVLS